MCDFRLQYGRELPTKIPIISINRSKTQGKLNEGFFWTATLFLECDVNTTIQKMALKLSENEKKEMKERTSDWMKSLKESERKKEEANYKKGNDVALGREEKWKDGPTQFVGGGKKLLNPLQLLQRLEDVLPSNAILIGDGGDFVATAAYTVKPRGPLQWLDPCVFGTLGIGGGFALAAKLIHPERPGKMMFAFSEMK